MRSLIKKILAVLLIALVQFFPPTKNVSAAAPGPNDITVLYPTPPAVKAILVESCYDCHSDNTRYPWYTRIQPIGWWMQHHVNAGIDELNFSQFGTYTPKRAGKKLGETIKETKDREMPLTSYLVMHREARLTEAQIQLLVNWADGIHARIPTPAAP
jgi:hypothetical protein